MEFQMNNITYKIKEVSQEEIVNEAGGDIEEDEYFYGLAVYSKQTIYLDEDLSYARKRKTLIHELTHVYIREFITSNGLQNISEEMLCEMNENTHDIIHEIVEKYFNNTTL